MNGSRLDGVRSSVLDQMDRTARLRRMAIVGAAGVELLLLLIALAKTDWMDETQVLLFIYAVLGYTIIALGLVALGAHVSRVGMRVVAALDERDDT